MCGNITRTGHIFIFLYNVKYPRQRRISVAKYHCHFCQNNVYFIFENMMVYVDFPSVCCENALLPFVNKEASLAHVKEEYR